MSELDVDAVLVGPLRRTPRADDLLRALAALPPRLRTVLSACYLEGRDPAEIGAELTLTPAEVRVLSSDALRALGRSVAPAAPRRNPRAHAFLR